MNLEQKSFHISKDELINDQISYSKQEEQKLKESIEKNDHTQIVIDFFSGTPESLKRFQVLLRQMCTDEQGYISVNVVNQISAMDNSAFNMYHKESMEELFHMCGDPKVSLVAGTLNFNRLNSHIAHYNPVTNIMSISVFQKGSVMPAMDICSSVVAELTHAYQTKHSGAPSVIGRAVKNWLNPLSHDYNDAGNMEHDAHNIIEPILNMKFVTMYVEKLEAALICGEIDVDTYNYEFTTWFRSLFELKNVDFLGVEIVQFLLERDLTYFFDQGGRSIYGLMDRFLTDEYIGGDYEKHAHIYIKFIEKAWKEGGMSKYKGNIDKVICNDIESSRDIMRLNEMIFHIEGMDHITTKPIVDYLKLHFDVIAQNALSEKSINVTSSQMDKDSILAVLNNIYNYINYF